jgi:uncharacterized protein
LKILGIILCVCVSCCYFSQSLNNDLLAIQNKDFKDPALTKKTEVNYVFKGKNVFVKYNPVSLVFGGALFFYQRIVSRQILQGCAFNPSCSHFSKQCLKSYGLVKGLALSADRLTRCTRLSAADFHPAMFDENGRINDLPDYYRWPRKR